jgi:hypothetical protein
MVALGVVGYRMRNDEIFKVKTYDYFIVRLHNGYTDVSIVERRTYESGHVVWEGLGDDRGCEEKDFVILRCITNQIEEFK